MLCYKLRLLKLSFSYGEKHDIIYGTNTNHDHHGVISDGEVYQKIARSRQRCSLFLCLLIFLQHRLMVFPTIIAKLCREKTIIQRINSMSVKVAAIFSPQVNV